MLLSILKLKCPKCHKGDMFVEPNFLKPSTITKTHKNCLCCDVDFIPEPGFYFGAMYVSYGLGVIYFLLSFFVLYLLLNLKDFTFLGIYIATTLLSWPYIFRISRVIYLSLFVRYDKNAGKKCDANS